MSALGGNGLGDIGMLIMHYPMSCSSSFIGIITLYYYHHQKKNHGVDGSGNADGTDKCTHTHISLTGQTLVIEPTSYWNGTLYIKKKEKNLFPPFYLISCAASSIAFHNRFLFQTRVLSAILSLTPGRCRRRLFFCILQSSIDAIDTRRDDHRHHHHPI